MSVWNNPSDRVSTAFVLNKTAIRRIFFNNSTTTFTLSWVTNLTKDRRVSEVLSDLQFLLRIYFIFIVPYFFH